VILRHYLDIERGDLFLALGRYNGSRGKAEYPEHGVRRAPRLGHRRPADVGGQARARPAARRRHPSSASTRSTLSSTISSMLAGGGRRPAAAGRRCRPSR
jgi:hypothetical protein